MAELAELELLATRVSRRRRSSDRHAGRRQPHRSRCFSAGRIGIAAQCIGIVEAAMAEGIAYAAEREAFGQPLIGFQNTRARAGRCAHRAGCRLAARAARCAPARFRRSRTDGIEHGQACRLGDPRQGRRGMLQIHGAYGYSREYEIQRTVIARELLR